MYAQKHCKRAFRDKNQEIPDRFKVKTFFKENYFLGTKIKNPRLSVPRFLKKSRNVPQAVERLKTSVRLLECPNKHNNTVNQ